jgi:soluble lytic murein transglycosylase-like protein
MIMERLSSFKDVIKTVSNQLSIDEILLYAIIWQESHGDCWGPRFESHYYEKAMHHLPSHYAEKLGVTAGTERILQSMSWGPMQVMGVVAREEGYDGPMPRLCLPEVGVYWGARKLQKLFKRYPENQDHVISAYNAGSARDTEPAKEGYQYSNQHYVDSVKSHMEQIIKGEDI